MTESFITIRDRFERWYRREYGVEIVTSALYEDRRIPDFVLLYPGKQLEIVELKRRAHRFNNDEYDRLDNYITAIDTFLERNPEFQDSFGEHCHASLVCDEHSLSGSQQRAFESLIREGRLDYISWDTFLVRTRNAHQDFLEALRTG